MVEYYESTNISQSQLKLLLVNPTLFNTVREPESFYEEKRHFIIGSAVDCLLTTPEEFDNKYYVSTLENKPSDVVKNIIYRVFEKIKDGYPETLDRYLGAWRGTILEAAIEENYYNNLTNTVRIDKIVIYQKYFDSLWKAEGKQILSTDEKDVIDAIVMSLTTNDVTRPYIVNTRTYHFSNHLYQLAINWVYKGVSCKSLLDIVIFDHGDKTIQPIDIKTLGDYTNNFPKSLRKRRYDIQAAFYTEALKQLYPEYTILPFKFIVESTIKPGNPLIFTCDESLLKIGKYGRKELFIEDSQGVMYKLKEEILGFDSLIELYKFHLENGFQHTKEVLNSKGDLLIDWEGIL